MPKVDVILTHNIVGLGGESDQVKVAAGYARNYLFPQNLAIPLTGANQRRIDALRKRRAARESHELSTMTELARSVEKLLTVIRVKTGDDGKMFGAVTSGAVADQLKTQFDITLDKKKIHLDHPIKTLGEHEAELRLHPEVTVKLKIRVESTTPLPEKPAAPAREEKRKPEDSKGADRPERRKPRAPKGEKAE